MIGNVLLGGLICLHFVRSMALVIFLILMAGKYREQMDRFLGPKHNAQEPPPSPEELDFMTGFYGGMLDEDVDDEDGVVDR